jgi:hypothetical protein
VGKRNSCPSPLTGFLRRVAPPLDSGDPVARRILEELAVLYEATDRVAEARRYRAALMAIGG